MTNQSKLKLILVGCEGKMGQAIRAQITSDATCLLVGEVDQSKREIPTDSADVIVVDFSSEKGTTDAISIAYDLQAPLLTGTTGLTQQTHEALEELGSVVPVGVVPNTSFGIAVMGRILGIAATLLRSDSWSLEVVEKHHAKKKDAPSGTALALAKVCSENGVSCSTTDINSIREGQVVGTHEFRFVSDYETITIRHEAHDRMLFAQGALHLARALRERSPGIYDAEALFHPQNG
ncbi:MAG: hypothetical protein MK077_06865 [Phycisphaerales bacterium]|nr:hypothetical protein [Phycisphaerales bacterium]